MANFYSDNADLKHHLNHPMMRRLVELHERNFTEAEKYDYAPLDFEDAMDSYEKFMGEYVEIMKKYNANPNDMSLLTDYTNYMIDYTEFCEDFEKWNSEEMNDAELAYYLEVQTRVNQKLLELSQ